MSVVIDASGVKDLLVYLERFPKVTREAMRIALNETARGPAMKAAKRNILEQINYPSGYLDTRLTVKQFATDTNLEARIEGRDRPTSLARFAQPGTPFATKGRQPPNPGATVIVKPGQPRRFKSAFLVSLKNGNIGFAIRVKKGQVPEHAYKPTKLWADVYLLYGPSVDQAFQDVAVQVSEEVTSDLENEFHRQFARLSAVVP